MSQHKCNGCFWKTGWEDDTGRFPICERIWFESFEKCKAECDKPGPCPHYITDEEVSKIAVKVNDNPN